jgi:argininosuccinate lyase
MAVKKPWAGRFSTKTNKEVEKFTASIDFDKILYQYDIAGSIAHCKMLAKQKIISQTDAAKIIKALKMIEKEIEQGEVAFTPELEDIHMHIENLLIKKIGTIGAKLHTARSRNDQIALDISLYLRDTVTEVVDLLDKLQATLLGLAEKHIDVVMPGFTHLQHAQPVLLSHHLMAYFFMLQRDRERMLSCFSRANRMPLGAAAMAGTPYPIDRKYVAELLGYASITENSIDSVSDRDTIIEFCSGASIIMMHLSRFCEELVLWSSTEFQFVALPDAFCTGSSIMPQKKNPDVLELIRGKTGRVYGHVVALLALTKSLPLSYNRDLQEDKEALFDTVVTLQDCLKIFTLMLPKIKIQIQNMAEATNLGFPTATDLADCLVTKGIPFRLAHEIVGRIVAKCVGEKRELRDLSLHELKQFSPAFKKDALQYATIQHSINSRSSPGGTARQTVKKTIKKAKADLKKRKGLIEKIQTYTPKK